MFQHISCIIFPYHRSSFFSSTSSSDWEFCFLAKGTHQPLWSFSIKLSSSRWLPWSIPATRSHSHPSATSIHHGRRRHTTPPEKAQVVRKGPGQLNTLNWKFWSKNVSFEMKQMDAMTNFCSWIASGNKLWRLRQQALKVHLLSLFLDIEIAHAHANAHPSVDTLLVLCYKPQLLKRFSCGWWSSWCPKMDGFLSCAHCHCIYLNSISIYD